MCFHRRTRKEDSVTAVFPTPPSSPKRPPRSENDLTPKGSNEGKHIYLPESVPNEMKPEQVQNRLVPVIKNLFDHENLNKTGGSSGLLAEKLAEKNKLDKSKDLQEQTCEEDCNYYNIRKDILAIVDKSHTKKEADTVYDRSKKKKNKGKDQSKKNLVGKAVYKRDSRQSQSKSREEKSKSNSLEKVANSEYDTENDVNEKNFMYNLKEIDYCTHDMIRYVDEDNLNKNIPEDCKMPEKAEPYGDLELLAKRKYSTCKVLRRNTLMSLMWSMPSADEKEHADTATAKHMTEHCAIRFLPPTTLIQHCDDMREDHTNGDASDLMTGTAIAITLPPATAVPMAVVRHDDSSKKKEDKKKKEKGKVVEATCESERKTAEEI